MIFFSHPLSEPHPLIQFVHVLPAETNFSFVLRVFEIIVLSNSVIEIYHITVEVSLNVLLDETKFTSGSVFVCAIGIKFKAITNHLHKTKFIL